MSEKIPFPGTDEAINAGCNCPVLDNNHGKGMTLKNPETGELSTAYWVNADCVLHGVKDTTPEE